MMGRRRGMWILRGSRRGVSLCGLGRRVEGFKKGGRKASPLVGVAGMKVSDGRVKVKLLFPPAEPRFSFSRSRGCRKDRTNYGKL